MTRLMLALALVSLAACGVDGEPQPPAPKAGVQVSGDAYAGVTGTL